MKTFKEYFMIAEGVQVAQPPANDDVETKLKNNGLTVNKTNDGKFIIKNEKGKILGEFNSENEAYQHIDNHY